MDAAGVYNHGRHRVESDLGYGASRAPSSNAAAARQDRPYSSGPGNQQPSGYNGARHGAPIPTLAPGAALSYDLDHIATFSAVSRHHGRLMTPEEGMKQFRQMVHKSGIWNLRVRLLVRTHELVIFDAETHDEMENFPIELISRPAAFFSRKPDDIYRNIVVLTVLEDPLKELSESEIHIFQSFEHSAQEIVDNIAAVKRGRLNGLAADYPSRTETRHLVNVQRANGERVNGLELAAQKTANVVHAYRQNTDADSAGVQRRPKTGREKSGENFEQIEHWTEILNKCIDDIERFMGRLKSVAEAYRELEKKQQNRKGGMLTMRTRSPSYVNFVDIFQKFRLAFNLLARLKHHIQGPNSMELVHALFSPLGLLYEASLNVMGEHEESATRINVPPMSPSTISLLSGCLTFNEKELWRMLGDTWTASRSNHRTSERDDTYIPTFYDGWAPPAVWLSGVDSYDDDEHMLKQSRSEHVERRSYTQPQAFSMESQMMPSPSLNERTYGSGFIPPPSQDHVRPSSTHKDSSTFDRLVTKLFKSRSTTASSVNTKGRDEQSISSKTTASPSHQGVMAENGYEKNRPGKKIPTRPRFYEVIKNRQYAKPDELTVRKGEIVEVLETKNTYWKVLNSQGMIGFVPKSCFQPYFQMYQP